MGLQILYKINYQVVGKTNWHKQLLQEYSGDIQKTNKAYQDLLSNKVQSIKTPAGNIYTIFKNLIITN